MSESAAETGFPLFPLSTVLYPGGMMPLRIFEPRYLDMISRVMRDDARFGVVAIREGAEVGEAALPAEVGTIARIVDFKQEDDGLLGIAIRGEQRFLITASEVAADNLLSGAIRVLAEAEPEVPAEDHARLIELLRSLWAQLKRPAEKLRLDDAGWVAYRLAEILPLPLELKQQLLETPLPVDKLSLLSRQLADWKMRAN